MSTSTKVAAAALLIVHASLLALSIPRNAVTIDEVVHLPTGIAYWQRGEFWGYHHSPPLLRLVCAVPVVLIDVPVNYNGYQFRLHSRAPDCDFGRAFMLLNQKHYLLLFCLARSMTAVLSLIGGWFVFRWSRELFGDPAGLLSLALWCLSPNVLAHAGLVTTDLGSSVLGFIATYYFWRYLRSRSLSRACGCGLLLGLAIASKFTFILLPLLWAVLAVMRIFQRRLPAGTAAKHAVVVFVISILTVNNLYLGEGTGRSLRARVAAGA